MNDDEILELDRLENTHFWYQIRKLQLAKWIEPRGATALKVLDLGSATGGNTEMLISLGFEVTSVEYSDVGVSIQKSKRIEVLKADARSLPFTNDSFDIVICLDVLEHILEEGQAVAEIQRVLRHDGEFLVSVPEDPKLWSDHDVAVDHFRRYTRDSIRSLITTGGLEISENWSSLIFLRPAIVFARKFTIGSNLKELPYLLNLTLFYICKIEFLLPKSKAKGVTLWISGRKL